MSSISLTDFDFHLPDELIAQTPAHPRDSARLLVYDRASQRIHDDIFRNLGHWLHPDTTLVMNNSKVEKARLLNGNMEIFIVRQINPTMCEALIRPGKKFRVGKSVEWADGVRIETLSVSDDGLRTLRLERPIDDPFWDRFRQTPFPPYIKADESLADEYQTVYAKPEGSKAAPTAGLHFTTELLERLALKHPLAEVTLHVGMGTFAPVKADRIEDHTMHSEWTSIDASTAEMLSQAKHLTAVGTTTTRVLESLVLPGRHFEAASGDTAIFITPGYAWKAVDSLITNFHLPKSTLLMLVAALTGVDELRRIYAHAISERYRFYSFGDAMLIR
jgi:S-adenosylmethionine:tRNA ribosyltransferase-isomerase